MICIILRGTSKSKISIDELWNTALPAVIGELVGCGYAVDGSSRSAVRDGERKFVAKYRVEPGPATLVAGVDDGEDRIQFTLTGAAFGKRVEGQGTDPVVWMRLVVLGVKFREAYRIDARVTDPDVKGTGGGV